MKTLGIDLGVNGGFCLLDDNHEVLLLMAMPKHVDGGIDHYEIEQFFAKVKGFAKKDLVIITEKVHAIFGNSAKSMNTFGENNGYIKGLVHVWFGRDIRTVTPRKWQRWLTTHTETEDRFKEDGKRDTKGNALAAITSLYKDLDLRKNKRCRNPHDGIVDAIGIALYGAYNEKTEQRK